MSSPSRPTPVELLAEVENGPTGPQVAAFFDFDGTLIDGYSINAFARHHLRSMQLNPLDAGRMLLLGLRGVHSEHDFGEFFQLGLRAWAGRSADELTELGERLFVQGIAGSLYPEAWRLVAAHRKAGHTVVFASSATRFQVEPAARAMGVTHLLCTPVEIVNGICTGRPGGPPLWRSGKAAAVKAFAAEHAIDLADSYAYSNGEEDVPFLETVGRPHALNPQRGLAEVAARKGWPVTEFAPRGRAGVEQLARTAATVAGMLGGFGTGLALGALSGRRRDGIDLGIALAGDLGSALAGIRFEVQGAEHLVSPRPAVFLFNHQSALDVLILAKLLRGGFTGVAKKEAADVPGFGLAFRLADVAFVDRGNTAQAKEALAPAVQRLKDGVSLVMAPEGTRSATPALGRFKKGAFHVAMQAGAPIVPIVICNAGELMWRGAWTTRPGTVQVVVLPPIPTEGWTVEDLDEHVERVRNSYLETLGETDPATSPDVAAPQPAAAPSGAAPLAAPRGWGTSPEMNPLETVMWRAEAGDERLRSNVALLEILDRAPDWSRLCAAHERALTAIPRMRQRVTEPPFGIGAPRWVPVHRVDLDRHLQRRTLDAPGSDRQLLDLAQEFAHAPLDRDRPLWEAMLVTGLSGERAAYLVKTHHSVTDGLGAVQLLARLHSRTAEPTASVAPAEAEPAGPAVTPQRPPAPARPSVLRSALGGLLHPQELARRVLDTGSAVVRAAVPAGAGSPLLRARGGGWRFDLLEVDLARLKAGTKAAGGSVNDGFIAALLGGFRRYHERSGSPIETMPVAIPISLRAEDDPLGGNRFTGVRFSAPVGDPDPASRIEAVRGFVLTARRSAAVDVVPMLAPALALLPAPLLAGASGAITAATDVQASSFPGIPYPVFIAGARITHMFPFGPLPGCAAMITMISHDGTCCIGVNTDPAAVTDPELLLECLGEGFDEVLALAGEPSSRA